MYGVPVFYPTDQQEGRANHDYRKCISSVGCDKFPKDRNRSSTGDYLLPGA
ncbi:MAG: hypothetical protein QOJ51_1660 [Acidobacteriaceae bacterium]|nr:hypothetical protein [Acidobacteriaceae bacterium]